MCNYSNHYKVFPTLNLWLPGSLVVQGPGEVTPFSWLVISLWIHALNTCGQTFHYWNFVGMSLSVLLLLTLRLNLEHLVKAHVQKSFSSHLCRAFLTIEGNLAGPMGPVLSLCCWCSY